MTSKGDVRMITRKRTFICRAVSVGRLMSAFPQSGRSYCSIWSILSGCFRPRLRQNVPEFDSNGPAHHYRVAAVVAGFLVPTFICFHSQYRSCLPPDCAILSFDAASATSGRHNTVQTGGQCSDGLGGANSIYSGLSGTSLSSTLT